MTKRYYYASFELVEDSMERSLQAVSPNLPDFTPFMKDLVKVLYTKGIWNITTISSKLIHIDYILELNPGGSVPAWVVNYFCTKAPMETFENLKQKMITLNQK
jgi:hypothetical protein